VSETIKHSQDGQDKTLSGKKELQAIFWHLLNLHINRTSQVDLDSLNKIVTHTKEKLSVDNQKEK